MQVLGEGMLGCSIRLPGDGSRREHSWDKIRAGERQDVEEGEGGIWNKRD